MVFTVVVDNYNFIAATQSNMRPIVCWKHAFRLAVVDQRELIVFLLLASFRKLLKSLTGTKAFLQGLTNRIAFGSIHLHRLAPLRNVKWRLLGQTTGHAWHQPGAAVKLGVLALKCVLVVSVGKFVVARVVSERIATDRGFGATEKVVEDETLVKGNFACGWTEQRVR